MTRQEAELLQLLACVRNALGRLDYDDAIRMLDAFADENQASIAVIDEFHDWKKGRDEDR